MVWTTSTQPAVLGGVIRNVETHGQLESHLAVFLDAYNFARRLKTLRSLGPYDAICKAWAEEPDRLRLGR